MGRSRSSCGSAIRVGPCVGFWRHLLCRQEEVRLRPAWDGCACFHLCSLFTMMTKGLSLLLPGGGSVFWVGFFPMLSLTCCCVLTAAAVVSLFTWHTVGVARIILDVPSVIADFTVLPASACPQVPGTVSRFSGCWCDTVV